MIIVRDPQPPLTKEAEDLIIDLLMMGVEVEHG